MFNYLEFSMFLRIGLLLCSCLFAAAVAVEEKKNFAYHDGYGSLSKKYIDELVQLHPTFKKICQKDTSVWSHLDKLNLLTFTNNDAYRSECDKALVAWYVIRTQEISEYRLRDAA